MGIPSNTSHILYATDARQRRTMGSDKCFFTMTVYAENEQNDEDEMWWQCDVKSFDSSN